MPAALEVSNAQAKAWLQRLVNEAVIEKQKKPAGYIVIRVTNERQQEQEPQCDGIDDEGRRFLSDQQITLSQLESHLWESAKALFK